jgi:hypothetical protein
MSDLKLRGEKNAREQKQQHQKAICSAVPHDFQTETSSQTQICVCRRRFSAAC